MLAVGREHEAFRNGRGKVELADVLGLAGHEIFNPVHAQELVAGDLAHRSGQQGAIR